MYSSYVFKNLEEPDKSWDRYITVVECPNWQSSCSAQIDQIGFLEYEPVHAGDTYVERGTGLEKAYTNTANYFINFIPEVRTVTSTTFEF